MIQPNRTLMIVLVAVAGTQCSSGSELRAEPLTGAQPKSAPTRPAAGAPVSLFRGGPQQTGLISGRIALEHPKVLAIKRTDGDPGEPLLADGVIYVGDRRENVHALSITGRGVVWRAAGQGFVYSAPARRGEVIFVASQHGLSALDRRTGRRLWNQELSGNATESSPLIVKDRIIVGDSSGTITAVDFDGSGVSPPRRGSRRVSPRLTGRSSAARATADSFEWTPRPARRSGAIKHQGPTRAQPFIPPRCAPTTRCTSARSTAISIA